MAEWFLDSGFISGRYLLTYLAFWVSEMSPNNRFFDRIFTSRVLSYNLRGGDQLYVGQSQSNWWNSYLFAIFSLWRSFVSQC